VSAAPGNVAVPPEHPNAVAYRRTADAFRARDFAALQALFDFDVVWHIPGHNIRAGEVHGFEAVIALLSGLPAGYTISEHDVLGNDEHVVALSNMGVRRPDLELMTRVVSVFHFREGRQVERWFYPEDMATWDQAFSLPGEARGDRGRTR
jgi:ketosteroid isomerase-like protein